MIFGLAGKKRAGKSITALHLVEEYGFVEYSWATPIKEVIGKLIFGLTDEQMYGPEEIKEKVIEEWGMSPRTILQIVGTDMFRKLIREDFWVHIGMKNLTKLNNEGYNIVVSDCRFPNELEAIKSLGGIVANVVKIGQVNTDSHASETALDDYKDWDIVFDAVPGDLEGLRASVDIFISELMKTKLDAI